MAQVSPDSEVVEPVAEATATWGALPFVQFSSDPPSRARLRVQIYENEYDAVHAAHHERGDEFFDAGGHGLNPVRDRFGEQRMGATGTADPDEVKRRLVVELRAGAERSDLSSDEAAEAEAVAVWLESSPSLELAMYGIGLSADLVYVRPDDGVTLKCKTCNANQKRTFGMPPCCN
jgi:hypothetical protein